MKKHAHSPLITAVLSETINEHPALKPTKRSGRKQKSGLTFAPLLTDPEHHPFDDITWIQRDSVIRDEKGAIIHQVNNIEVPEFWSQLATDIIAFKYFRKRSVPRTLSPHGAEWSVKQVITRVAHTIRLSGEAQGGYFASHEDAANFEAELTYLLVHQMGAFNSPVWFNMGLFHAYGITGQGGHYYWDEDTQTTVQTQNAYEHPQCSACFIQRIDDDLMGIFDTLKSEARLFKYGSGTGTNFSRVRSKYEELSSGGTSSGLMSFLEVFDRAAGATKSGGTTRRAAKMVILDMDHPEIEDFISWKAREEKKAHILIEYGGYSADFNGEAYHTISGQNSNNSVRVTDAFMQAVENDGEWRTTYRTTGKVHKTYKARDLMDQIAAAAWQCADPGIQYDTTINTRHTCPNSDRISASNPCSEYMFIDNSACNLASLNLAKYLNDDGTFNVKVFTHAVRVFTTAMDIIIDLASYPTAPIAENSHKFRPLGLGYANLGTLLMLQGIPYDSDEGRAWAAAITAILHAKAYKTSAELAWVKGPFSEYALNREPFLRVMELHRESSYHLDTANIPTYLVQAAQALHDDMVELGRQNGYRNAQTTTIAPTGTIGFLMDCATTGLEPDYALVKFKKLAGGGSFKIINETVPVALKRLNYTDDQIRAIITYIIGTGTLHDSRFLSPEALRAKGLHTEEIDRIEAQVKSAFALNHVFNVGTIGEAAMGRLGIPKEEYQSMDFDLLKRLGFIDTEVQEATDEICGRMTIEGAPHLHLHHLPVFDCASRCGQYGTRSIVPLGHVKMMAAIQPFISGAISKTVNMPTETTVEEVKEIYMTAWKMGLKAVALYRDGSKWSQPLSTGASKIATKTEESQINVIYKPQREHLPDERQSITHKFSISGHEGYVTVGLYDDGRPGEIFLRMAKTGSTVNGLLDSFGIMASLALQYGTPLDVIVKKFSHQRFEPAGFTQNPHIRIAKSITDYIARWLALRFLDTESQAQLGINLVNPEPNTTKSEVKFMNPEKGGDDRLSSNKLQTRLITEDAPACPDCGSMTVRNGTCYKCLNCGSTTGCS